MERLNNVFKALSDETRLRVLSLLLEAPACVCEMQEVLALPQSLLSRHLAQLRNAGLVTSERQGTRMVYSVRRQGGHPPGLWRWLKPAPGVSTFSGSPVLE